jgi:outer membrane protein
MNRPLMILLVASLAFVQSAICDPIAAYSFDDCLRIGLERAATLRNARRDESIADAQISQVRSQVIPQANLDASYTRLGEAPESFEGEAAGLRDNYAVSAEATQLLYAGGKVRTALEAARLFRDASSYATLTATARLVRDIHRGFHQVRLTAEEAQVATQSVAQLSLLVGQTEVKQAQGTVSEFELLSARVRLANERPKWIAARNQHELAKASFANLLHLGDTAFELTGEPALPPVTGSLDSLTRLALASRPELSEMARRVDLSKADIDLADSGRYPEIKAFTSYNGNNPDFYQPDQDAWQWGWQAGVRLSWSLFDGGLRRATVQRKTVEWEKSRTDYDELANAIRLEVRQAWLVWLDAQEALRGALDNVRLAERAQQIAAVRQDQGLSTYLEFTESNLALSTARLAHFRALRAKALAEAQILYACGHFTEPLPPPETP